MHWMHRVFSSTKLHVKLFLMCDHSLNIRTNTKILAHEFTGIRFFTGINIQVHCTFGMLIARICFCRNNGSITCTWQETELSECGDHELQVGVVVPIV